MVCVPGPQSIWVAEQETEPQLLKVVGYARWWNGGITNDCSIMGDKVRAVQNKIAQLIDEGDKYKRM